MPSREIRPPSRSRLSLFFSSPGLPAMLDDTGDLATSPRTCSPVQHVASSEPPRQSRSSSVDQNDKSQRLSLYKARKLSRVIADFSGSLLDPFTSRKSTDDLRTARGKSKATLRRPATSHGHSHKSSLGGYSLYSFDSESSRPTSPTSPLPSLAQPISAMTMPTSEPKSPIEKTAQSTVILDPLSAPQIKPSIPPPPESLPLSPSRPGSSRGLSIAKRRRKSLNIIQLEDNATTNSASTRSRSLRITSLSRPTTPKSPSDLSVDMRDPPASPEGVRQHFVEVKRARKMTQLFGQELPPELVRVLDDRRNAQRPRRRAGSTASSTVDSSPSTPTHENIPNASEGENVMPTLPPTMPRVDFQERRRRVAKLSQFFGVNHSEIASSVVFTKPNHHPAVSIDELQKQVSISSEEPAEVGVKVIRPRRWGLGADMRDVEMSDAISKLRGLRAT
ncbi:hypothetical protein NP233_g6414 [Leucocoprinus birnbaumii]|uniref:Uncharacterized protein n=1 Tax=Leucocoprinus birnbaumii TaxID=56174 RepID=A0AAD5VS95_9AGAR|nr:hypothetical protein NP233_g6414 [Leucocoprinus birnbaumii]